MTEDSNELKTINEQLNIVREKQKSLKNEEYQLNSMYLVLLKEKCKENIGRCFKKMKNGKIISYCKIININDAETNGRAHFNEYQYPAIWFKYPYKNSFKPFYENDLFSAAWGKGNDYVAELNCITYEEISKEEFFIKFENVNNLWKEYLKF